MLSLERLRTSSSELRARLEGIGRASSAGAKSAELQQLQAELDRIRLEEVEAESDAARAVRLLLAEAREDINRLALNLRD